MVSERELLLESPARQHGSLGRESLYPPNQPLNGGNPIENLTGNHKRKFQFMIVSFDTIFPLRLAGHAFVYHGKEYQIDRPPP